MRHSFGHPKMIGAVQAAVAVAVVISRECTVLCSSCLCVSDLLNVERAVKELVKVAVKVAMLCELLSSYKLLDPDRLQQRNLADSPRHRRKGNALRCRVCASLRSPCPRLGNHDRACEAACEGLLIC